MKKNAKNTNEEIIIDMPEVKDIPGQEHIKPPHFGEMSDVTASSADEEGEGILDDLNREDDDDILTDEDDSVDADTNVSNLDKQMLAQADSPMSAETADVSSIGLDKVDEDGEELNEQADGLDMGKDLDVPGSEDDDANEELGEEDEENNSYSARD
jgi:hypothetical protein